MGSRGDENPSGMETASPNLLPNPLPCRPYVNVSPGGTSCAKSGKRVSVRTVFFLSASLNLIGPLKNSVSGRLSKNDEMQGARILRNEAYDQYAAMTKDEAQRSRSRFSKACYGADFSFHFFSRVRASSNA